MKTQIKDGMLTITIPVNANPPLSNSGKTRVVATTNGFLQGEAVVNNHPIKVSLNVIIPRD
jgi:hypothetical protein